MSTLRVDTITDGVNSVSSDTVIKGASKSWINFNGTGVIAARASFTVTSLTDNGTGDYRVNLSSSMVDANYAVVAGGSASDVIGAVAQVLTPRSLLTASYVVKADYNNGVYLDFANCYCAVCR